MFRFENFHALLSIYRMTGVADVLSEASDHASICFAQNQGDALSAIKF